jgi:UDP-glucose 6-dehydrogenase
MKIAVFGLGYVGTVTAVVPTEQGHKVEGNVQEQAAIDEIFNDKKPLIGRSWNTKLFSCLFLDTAPTELLIAH